MTRPDPLKRFFRFATVGFVGYCVDVMVLYLAMWILHSGPYLGRVPSYLCAATATWYLHRHFTFADARSEQAGREWLKFITFNGIGGTLNYIVYVLCIQTFASSGAGLTLAVAFGALAGLSANYLLSRKLVFGRAQ